MSPNQIPGVSGLRRRVDEAIRWRAAIAIDEARMGFNERIERAEAKAEWTANEMRRLAPQLAAVEQRLADLETRVAAGGQGDAGQAEAGLGVDLGGDDADRAAGGDPLVGGDGRGLTGAQGGQVGFGHLGV